ncbi:dethiobiotin synthase [Kangiella marina]|uniref:ATP-dependent dethiobiotin synthetase BioD n=1 Tax=Kangiella marina TaxID=1079178 RepID=A0ABP8IFP9_9GAMM
MSNANQKYFVAGTDTEIGKTFISAALIRGLVAKGHAVAGLKPIASGAEPVQGVLKNEDALQLQQASNMGLSYRDINPLCFEPAIAPHIAADLAGQLLNVEELANKVVMPDDADVVLVEGAGGWLTPLNQTETYADWVEQEKLDVILVVGMKLGCLNHAMLSVRNIESRGLKLAGWVANFAQGKMNMAEDNLKWLKDNMPAPCLGIVPYQDKSKSADDVAQLLDVSTLL